MSPTNEAPVESRTEPMASPQAIARTGYDPDPENWLSRGIGIFLGLAVSAAAVGGVIGLLFMHGH